MQQLSAADAGEVRIRNAVQPQEDEPGEERQGGPGEAEQVAAAGVPAPHSPRASRGGAAPGRGRRKGHERCGDQPEHGAFPLRPGSRGRQYAGELLHRLARVPELAWLVLSDLASVSEWAVLWLLVAAVVLRARRRPWSGRERWFAAMVVAYVGALSCSYLFSTWTPWQPHVTLSIARLIFHVTPVALWLTALRWCAREDLQPRDVP